MKSLLIFSLNNQEVLFDALKIIDSLKNQTKMNLDLVLVLSQKCLILINSKYESHIIYGLELLIRLIEWIKKENKLKTSRVLSLIENIANEKRITKIKMDEKNKKCKYSVILLFYFFRIFYFF